MRTRKTTNDNQTQQTTTNMDAAIREIAWVFLSIGTLEVRNMDSLDFHSVSVTGLRNIMEAAYKAGQANANRIV